jgi:hypothetical protein
MTYTEYPTLEQGSDEWIAARCGVLTASQIGKLITNSTLMVANNDASRGLTEALVAERITGHVEYVHPSFSMQRGSLDEPYARGLYSAQYEPVTELGFAVRTINGHKLGASPDGLTPLGGLEIKSRDPKIQLKTILSNTVPAENLAQVHANMTVFARESWDYCSYAGGWPLHVIRVHRDDKWQTAIRDALDKFEENAALMIESYKQTVGDAPVAPRIDHFQEVELKL